MIQELKHQATAHSSKSAPSHLKSQRCVSPSAHTRTRCSRDRGPSASTSASSSSVTRRTLLHSASCLGSLLLPQREAQAGLVLFPASRLQNRYILVRAGESFEDARGRVGRNPVWKTSQTSGLTKRGISQVLTQTVPAVEALGFAEDIGWIWPSIWQSSYMTAEILAYELGLGRSQIVPEYSFLDARGLGAFEGGEAALVAQQVAEVDAQDSLWRPPKGQDGTPHESLSDVFVRVRQVMSICETQYRNDSIVLIAPDSDVLSVLQAATLGVDLRQHTRFYMPQAAVRELVLANA